jgi:GNAT superfamily N-acetyltransferase
MTEPATYYKGLRDPLSAVRVLTALETEITEKGLLLQTGTDFGEFNRRVLSLRGQRCGPFHDPEVSNLSGGRALWLALATPDGRDVAVQAFRIDFIGGSLADWAPSFTIGLYMRRNELLVPTHASPPANSIAERIGGRLVYHGELWIDPEYRGQGLMLPFGRIGLLLSLIKWQPDAIWALFEGGIVHRGVPLQLGYAYQERGFFRWQLASEGIESVEWIAVAERWSLEQLIAEIVTTPQ